jgi:hypothetical protein
MVTPQDKQAEGGVSKEAELGAGVVVKRFLRRISTTNSLTTCLSDKNLF